MPQPDTLPAVITGPLLRRLEPRRLVIWLMGSRVLALSLKLIIPQGETRTIDLDTTHCQVVPVGRHAFIHLIDVQLDDALPLDVAIGYDLLIDNIGIAEWAPHLLYAENQPPNFVLHSRIRQLVHGSCRKPHHRADEGLLCVDRLLAEAHTPTERPALLMMSGDQIYADDVAGPMLRAIHALIARLGLFDEYLEGAVVDDSASKPA